MRRVGRVPRAAVLLPVLALVLGLSGCAPLWPAGRLRVVASFYPLQYVAQRIVGPDGTVVGLTAPGVEPHDLELTPRQLAVLTTADVAVWEHGLQPAVDEGLANDPPRIGVDAARVVHLRPGDGGTDPHFWQDPTLLARVARAVADAAVRAEPGRAAAFRQRERSLLADLASLDSAYRSGLRQCRIRTLVVSHDAFEYLGRRYHLDVQAISGLTPDAEPSARRLAQLAALTRRSGVTTVFSERLASPAFADALANEAGVRAEVLDTLEGVEPGSHATYLTLMRANLAAIRSAGGCS